MPNVNFTTTPSSTCAGVPIPFTDANSHRLFTFAIIAPGDCALSSATISPIQIDTPPSSTCTAPPAACDNTALPFAHSTNPGFNQGVNSVKTYLWNLGDPASGANNTSTASNPAHGYAAPGIHTITRTASDGGTPVLSCGAITFTWICIEKPPLLFSV